MWFSLRWLDDMTGVLIQLCDVQGVLITLVLHFYWDFCLTVWHFYGFPRDTIFIIEFIFRCWHNFLNGDFTPWCKFGVKFFDFD